MAESQGYRRAPGWVREALREAADGWHPEALMVAYGISRRTAYRWRRYQLAEIELDGWRGLLRLRPDDAPILIGWWRLP